MERLGDEIRRELGRVGPVEGMAAIVSAWPGAVGETIARNAWPGRLARDGTLHVATSSSVWAFELGHLETDIRSRLERALAETGSQPPRRLRFAVGKVPEPGRDELLETFPPQLAPSPDDVAAGLRIASEIGSEELRFAVAKAAAASLARASAGRAV